MRQNALRRNDVPGRPAFPFGVGRRGDLSVNNSQTSVSPSSTLQKNPPNSECHDKEEARQKETLGAVRRDSRRVPGGLGVRGRQLL